MKPISRPLFGSLLLALLSACALGPLQPDREAKAPELQGFGELQWTVQTTSPAAQRLFTQGVLQAYAFNEAEAVRSFKAALAQDPACAMCAWGVAWQLGPNINNTSRSQAAEAARYIDLALRHAATATPRERALMDALALRYGHASQAQQARLMAPLLAERCAAGKSSEDPDDKPDPLDTAYAERLHTLVQATPQDAELLSLWAEAEMVATRTDWWSADGSQPAGRIGDVATALERALQAQPRHTGLNHYLIHAVDARGVARRAEAAADRLAVLAPASPHLVHMPSHTYAHIGRYGDAARVNEAAVAADLALFDVQKQQGFANSKDWRNHNQHYLWFAALMQGRGDVALQAARALAERSAQAQHVFADYRRSLPLLTLLRLQRWDAVLAEPPPATQFGLAQALGEQARGVAWVHKGDLAQARVALAAAEAGVATVTQAHGTQQPFDVVLREVAGAARDRLRAEIASAEGHHDEALQLQAQVVKASAKADSNEPPMLAAGARLALGELQLRAGRAAQAEQSFRDDLAANMGSGWALHGLKRALQAQGKAADMAQLQPQLDQAWSQADTALR